MIVMGKNTQKNTVSNQISFWTANNVTPLQAVSYAVFEKNRVKLYLKRDDLIHPLVSGNKWRKLKYNFLEAQQLGYDRILTFGGAYSNHIAATAAAGKHLNISTIGVIRGDELNSQSNDTLVRAAANGMQLIFVSRPDYQNHDQLAQLYGQNCYVLPEGGSNALAARGVAEVITEINAQLTQPPQYLATALGTGGTFAGLVNGTQNTSTRPLGFAVLKNGEYLLPAIQNWAPDFGQHQLFWDAHFGGYGQVSPLLRSFMLDFEAQTGVLIDPIYNAKMLLRLSQLVESGYFKPNDTIVALHTGGLQGRNEALYPLPIQKTPIFGSNSTV